MNDADTSSLETPPQDTNDGPVHGHAIPSRRNSSIELLRILCILLILANHYSVLGGIPARGWQNLTWGYFFVQSIGMFGRTACSVFVLITGYFLSAGTKPDHNRKIVPLAAEAVLYSSSAFFVLCALGFRTFSPTGLLLAFVPFLGDTIWFVTNYLVFWLAIPFLNPMVAALSKRQHQGLLAFFGVFWCLLPTFSTKALSFGWTFGELDFFLVMYLVGAYLRRFTPHERYRNRWNGLAALLFFALMVLSAAGMDLLGLWLRKDALVSHAVHFLSFYSVLSVPLAVFSFCFFSRLSFSNRAVDRIAKSVLGVYLLHMQLTDLVWQKISPNALHVDAPYFHALAKISLLFLFCLAIDQIRRETVGRFGMSFLRKLRLPCHIPEEQLYLSRKS